MSKCDEVSQSSRTLLGGRPFESTIGQRTPDRERRAIKAWPAKVMRDYFRAAGIPLLRGRTFSEADRPGAPLAVIVNRTLAERYWPGQIPSADGCTWACQ